MAGPFGPRPFVGSPLGPGPQDRRLLNLRLGGYKLPAASDFVESFSAALTAANWPIATADANCSNTVTGGNLVQAQSATSAVGQEAGEYSKFGWNLYEDRVFIKLEASTFGSTTPGGEGGFVLESGTGNGNQLLFIRTSSGLLQCAYRINDAFTSLADLTYANATHTWLSFKHTGTTISWDTAPDTASNPPLETEWVNRASISTATLPFTLDNFRYKLYTFANVNVGAISFTWDGLNTAVDVTIQNISSIALPATYAMTGVATSDAFSSLASPATYSYTGVAASDSLGSLASPATYAMTGVATADAFFSLASPATYSYTGVATTDSTGTVTTSIALPATYSYTGASAVDAIKSSALPATYSMTGVATTDSLSAAAQITSIALPATYSMTGVATSEKFGLVSQASPATYLMNPSATTEINTGTDLGASIPVTIVQQPPIVTDDDFIAWLDDSQAFRVVLFEVNTIDENGNTQRIFLSTTGYTTGPNDTIANQHYLPFLLGGLDFQQRVNMFDAATDHSYGDIEVDNTEGDLDYLLKHSWQYQTAKAYIGDATWSRNNFRLIFDGTVEDVDTSEPDVLNIKLRDKLYRLDMPLHDMKIGGASAQADQLLPVAFGECHNVTPVLLDEFTLKYAFHAGVAESAFEVRDNGIPVARSQVPNVAPASFQLTQKPSGRITCSVQGDAAIRDDVTTGYQNSVVGIIYRIVTGWGTEVAKRFTDNDIDLDNFYQFFADNQQTVGVYITERVTVLELAQEVAASIGARIVMTAQGKMQLIKINIPPDGTPIDIGPSDILQTSLRITSRPILVPAVKLGYAKNWTVQTDTAGGLPEAHKKLFAEEWITTTAINEEVRAKYGLWSEPEQENTLLIEQQAAIDEGIRRASLRSKQRHIYEMRGFAHLILTTVGSPIRMTFPRYDMEMGKTGQVTALSVDWLNAEVVLEVLA